MIASIALIGLGLVNYAGATLVEKLESFFNIGKIAVLGLFIVAGLLVGGLAWDRLGPAAWAPPSAIVASGMIGFLAYEGFELIANASDQIVDPKRTLPIAFLGSVIIAMVIYTLAFIVGIGHLSFPEISEGQGFRNLRRGRKLPWASRFRGDGDRRCSRVSLGDQRRLFRRRQTDAPTRNT